MQCVFVCVCAYVCLVLVGSALLFSSSDGNVKVVKIGLPVVQQGLVDIDARATCWQIKLVEPLLVTMTDQSF